MAEVKKISLKYVVLAFVIAVAFILLLSVDQRVNQPPEEELIAVEEQLGISIDPVTTKEIYEVQDGDNLSIILEDFEIPFNTCLLYTSPSPRDTEVSRMPSSA